MGIIMKFSLDVLLEYAFAIRVTNETGEFTYFSVNEPEVVVSRIMQEKEDINNISKSLIKALIVDNLLEYSAEGVAFLVC